MEETGRVLFILRGFSGATEEICVECQSRFSVSRPIFEQSTSRIQVRIRTACANFLDHKNLNWSWKEIRIKNYANSKIVLLESSVIMLENMKKISEISRQFYPYFKRYRNRSKCKY